MLTAQEIVGVCAMPATPSVPGGEHWSNTNSVDLGESARLIENLVRDGVGSLALNGTTGECAALLWEEKAAFIDTAVQVARKRVPIFAGATALGTKETIRQMRALKAIGADGAFVGLPLWQTPTMEVAVRWFQDLSEAVPDMPVMVYSNERFFKFNFPKDFWVGVAKRAPTVVTCKVTSQAIYQELEEIVRLTGHRIRYLPIHGQALASWKRVGDHVKACWATSAGLGPEPVVALMEAIQRGDERRAAEIDADLRAVPPAMPPGKMGEFAYYNVQSEKARFRAAGYYKPGMTRAPYYEDDLPEDWKQASEAHGKGWKELRKKYARAPV